MPSSKFGANLMIRLRVRRTSFSLFPLASACSNNYFCTYAIIDFLTKQLVFPNPGTYLKKKKNPYIMFPRFFCSVFIVVVVVLFSISANLTV